MTKVLMIGWELWPCCSGGLGVACYGLAKALSENGVQVRFVLPKKINIKCDFMDVVFANIDIDKEILEKSYITGTTLDYLDKEHLENFPSEYMAGAIEYEKKIHKLLKNMDVDIIHTHDWMTYGAGIAAKKALGKKLISHIHNTVFDRGIGSTECPEYKLEKRGFDNSDKIISVSGYTKNILVQKYGVDTNKIDVVHNGVLDIERKDVPPALYSLKKLGYKVVIFVGRLTLQKGPEYFLRAAKRVLEYEPKTLFIVIGSGDMEGQMLNEAAQLGIMDKVLFAGGITGIERDTLWQTADVYVMPSVSEPFGITALESVVNGTPVILSKQSGVSEVLKNVLKVDFWDVDEMANKIVSVLKYKSLPHDLIKESSKEIMNLSWDKSADEVISVYKQLI